MTRTLDNFGTLSALSCDVSTGLCGPADSAAATVQVTYVTDPICSACWASEPGWRALRYHYDGLLDVRHVYGGLLPGWTGFADAGAGISSPSDVAAHWDEVAHHTGQPIDSRVWAEDPIDSSFPPSVAAVAARLVAADREEAFLRHLREQLFLDGRNIARPVAWGAAADAVGIDRTALMERLVDGSAEQGFRADLAAARSSGAQEFPTVILESEAGRLAVRGTASFYRLEQALLAVSALAPQRRPVDLAGAVATLGTGTTAEYAALLQQDPVRVERALATTDLQPLRLPGGTAWRR